jgi:hypothetical protein
MKITELIPLANYEEFEKLLSTTIEERKENYIDKLQNLNLQQPLISFIYISKLENKYIGTAAYSSSLPESEWLRGFLKKCYEDCYKYFSASIHQ